MGRLKSAFYYLAPNIQRKLISKVCANFYGSFYLGQVKPNKDILHFIRVP